MSNPQMLSCLRRATILAMLFFSTCLFGCRENREKPPGEDTKLVELQKALNTYNFKGETPEHLASLKNLANRTDGDTSVQAHYFSARGYLDWFLTAAITRDYWLFSKLIEPIGVSSECKPGSKKEHKTDLLLFKSDTCRNALLNALHSGFASAAKKEGSTGSYVTLSTEAKTLIDWLFLPPSEKTDQLHGSFFRLLNTRGPIGTRARLALMYHFDSIYEELLERDQTTAAFVLTRLLPFPCPRVFETLLGLSSPTEIYSLLRKYECGYSCEGLDESASPDSIVKTAIKKCDFKKLGYNNPNDLKKHSIHASVAVRSMEALSRILNGIPESLSDPLIRAHNNYVQTGMERLSEFRIPLPIPGAINIGNEWITPPKIKTSQHPKTHSSPIVAVITKLGLYIATHPTAGLYKNTPRIIDSEKEGLSLPGRFFPSYPPDDIALVKEARRARALTSAGISTTPGGLEKIVVYMNGDDPASILPPQINRLTKANFRSMEMIYLSKASIIPAALEISLSTPPKSAIDVKTFLARMKKSGSEKDPTPVHLIVQPAAKETLKQLLVVLVQIKTAFPNVAFYWSIK